MFREILMALTALLAGAGVSAGVFAFVLVIGIIPRILEYSRTDNIILVENVMICGVIAGNISSVASGSIALPAGQLIIALYGLCVGIFVGCIAVALAEILHTFPVIFKRMKLRAGLGIIIIFMAIGKAAGALFYFLTGYTITS